MFEMNRRKFLQTSGLMGAQTLLASSVGSFLFLQNAEGSLVPVDSLKAALSPDEALVLAPTDAEFKTYQNSFNLRVAKVPSVRVLVKSPHAISVALAWAEQNKIPLALRCGGHSYEGFSQTEGLAIDLRLMNEVELSADKGRVRVQAGAALGHVYSGIGGQGVTIPAGSCPFVGVSGHTLGGGYGLLARPMGLACDSLLSAEVITSTGETLQVSATQNEDLFWALRGGGGGSFGVATSFEFKTHEVGMIQVFGASFIGSPQQVGKVLSAWQEEAPHFPREINAMARVIKNSQGQVELRVYGQSVGSQEQLQSELHRLTSLMPASKQILKTLNYLDAVAHFAGDSVHYPTGYSKSKSDYLTKPMSEEGCASFLQALPHGVGVIFDGYGGTLAEKANDETAFVHRQNVLCSLQYYVQWQTPSHAGAQMKILKDFYESARPFMSGGAYVNYCDLDLPDYTQAYWGANYSRLQNVKRKYDPSDVFRHAQSVKP